MLCMVVSSVIGRQQCRWKERSSKIRRRNLSRIQAKVSSLRTILRVPAESPADP